MGSEFHMCIDLTFIAICFLCFPHIVFNYLLSLKLSRSTKDSKDRMLFPGLLREDLLKVNDGLLSLWRVKPPVQNSVYIAERPHITKTLLWSFPCLAMLLLLGYAKLTMHAPVQGKGTST